MDTSLKSLREKLYALRAWDSSGRTQDDTIRQALNIALDRLAGEVPEALVPDEEHVVLMPDIVSTDADVSAIAKMAGTTDIGATTTFARAERDDYDTRIIEFFDTAGLPLKHPRSATTWRPLVTGEFDGAMHIELTNKLTGAIQRRQCIEFWTTNVDMDTGSGNPEALLRYRVTLERPLNLPIADGVLDSYDFRIYQPEFFVRDDVMEVLEPSVVYDGSRQQVWKIDTAGARRQDMLDYQGNSLGRPYRCWRGRHFQLQAPTEPPKATVANLATKRTRVFKGTTQPMGDNEEGGTVTYDFISANPDAGTDSEVAGGGITKTKVYAALAAAPADPVELEDNIAMWGVDGALPRGKFAICYTYVWGRKEYEWQKAPGVTPGSYENLNDFGGTSETDGDADLIWSHAVEMKSKGYDPTSTSKHAPDDNLRYSGIPDPQFESAPSPITVVDNRIPDGNEGAGIVIEATNIDAMLGFGDKEYHRFKHSGIRIRYYVAQLESAMENTKKLTSNSTSYGNVETNNRFYLLCEVEPTYNCFVDDPRLIGTAPAVFDGYFDASQYRAWAFQDGGARFIWNGHQLYDYYRPLRHSTGYYAWKVFPHQDTRYELDLRVLRLPEKFIDDSDTAPIQRDVVSALLELALYYISLNDGNDQTSAQAHLNRYQDLVKIFRERYANPGGIVEAVPFTGYRARNRYGTFGSTPLDD